MYHDTLLNLAEIGSVRARAEAGLGDFTDRRRAGDVAWVANDTKTFPLRR